MPRIKRRRTLIVIAILLQTAVLTVSWFVMFGHVRGRLTDTVAEYVKRENAATLESFSQEFEIASGALIEVGDTQWEELQTKIERVDLVAGGFACLLDPEGNILCHPDLRHDRSLLNVNLFSKVIEGTTAEGEAVRLGELGGETASGRIDFIGGGTHFVATGTIGASGYRLLVHQPSARLLNESERITATISLAGAVTVFIVVLSTGVGLAFIVRSYDSVFEAINLRLKGNLKLAREIQRGTLPRELPRVRGFEFAAWSESAEETGGDTYDVIGVAERGSDVTLTGGEADRAVLALADATGHGIGPALAVTQFRSMLRMAVRMNASLIGIVDHLNDQLLQDLPMGRFITAWLALVDGESGRVRTFSAGQGPIFLWRASEGHLERFGSDAPPLGVMDELLTTESTVHDLGPGDAIVAISDGLFEESNTSGELFGISRTESVIAAGAAGSAEEIVRAIHEAVEAFAGPCEPSDDRTIVVVKRA